MGDQVDLEKADALLVPGRPRAHGHLRLDERARLSRAEAAHELEPKRLQATVDRCGAHRQQLAPNQRFQTQRTFRFQRRDEFTKERCQALAA